MSVVEVQKGSPARPASPPVGSASSPAGDLSAHDFVDAFANAPVGIAVTDGVGGIIRANAAFAAMLGTDPDALVGKTVRDVTHPDDLPASLREIERLRNGEAHAFTIEKRYLARDGVVWARTNVSRIRSDPSDTRNVIYVEDVSERAAAETARTVSEERFRQMAEAVEQDFWIVDIDTVSLVYHSPAAEKIWGFDPAVNADDPQRIGELVHRDDFERFTIGFGRMLVEPSEVEYRITRPDGALRWLRSRGFPVKSPDGSTHRIAGITEDVTARKTAEQATRVQAELERLLTRVATGFITIPDDEIAAGVEKALADIVAFAGVDVAYIALFDTDRNAYDEIHLWSREDRDRYASALRAARLDAFPWYRERLLRGEDLYAPDVASTPPEAVAERRANEEFGITSVLGVPLMSAQGVIGTLVLMSMHAPIAWSEQIIRVLRVAADTFTGALERRRSSQRLARYAEFEQLVTKLSAEFINLPAPELARGIVTALEDLTRALHADRSGIFLLDPGEETLSLTYEWRRPGIERPGTLFRAMPVGKDHPFLARIVAEGMLYVPALDELGPEARAVEPLIRASGTAAFIDIPLMRAESLIGVLGFAWNAPRPAPLEDLTRVVRVAAQMFVNVLDRVRVEDELRKRLDLERLLTTFASDFINLPVSEIDSGIDGAIAQLGRYADVDRVGIFQLSIDGREVRTTHEWHSDAADDRPRAVRVRPRAGLGPLFDRLFAGETIQVSNIAELPPESSELRDTSGSYGVRSFINVPLVVGGMVVGWLSLGTGRQAMHWPEDAVALLKIAAEMFANALARIETERAMRRHQAELAHVLRVGTMGQLAAGLAHELNQPLSAILSYASGCTRRLEAGGAAPGELVGAMQRISEQALRAADFIKALRELVRKGEPHREWHDLNALVRGAIRMIDAELALAGVDLQLDAAAGLEKVQVNASQMQQVVLNLLQNALDALRELPVGQARKLSVSTAMVRPGLVSIRVEDNGPGIENHLKQTIFDDFHTSKPGGLGLGLSISRTLVEAHGGSLGVDSAHESAGAAFIVTLPSAA